MVNCLFKRPLTPSLVLSQDEDIQEIEDAGHKMQQQYCQFFDHVIVNDGLQAACVQLLTAVRRAQDEPQWVPAAWIKPSEQSWEEQTGWQAHEYANILRVTVHAEKTVCVVCESLNQNKKYFQFIYVVYHYFWKKPKPICASGTRWRRWGFATPESATNFRSYNTIELFWVLNKCSAMLSGSVMIYHICSNPHLPMKCYTTGNYPAQSKSSPAPFCATSELSPQKRFGILILIIHFKLYIHFRTELPRTTEE